MSKEIIAYAHGHDKCYKPKYGVNIDFCTGSVEIACKICGFILENYTAEEAIEHYEKIRFLQRESYRERYKYVLEKKD